MNFEQHVDLSGLGNSGKGILSDYLMEFDNVFVPQKDLEFNLFRAPGGLMDMHYGIATNWTPMRSDDSIRRFRKLARRLGARTQFSTIREMANSAGYCYERFYPGFMALTDKFLDDIVNFTYKGLWPYVAYHNCTLEMLVKRVRSKIKGKSVREEIFFSGGEDFTAKMNDYAYAVLDLAIDRPYKLYVTHNAFEPFEIQRYLGILKRSRSVLVTRDPRDIYTNVIEGNKARSGFYKRMDPTYYNLSAASNLDTFIEYQRKMLTYIQDYRHRDAMIIDFGDFIRNYADRAPELDRFLGLEEVNHTRKLQFFNPERSIKNVGIYRNFAHQDRITRIEKELSGLWDFNK